MRQDEVGRWGEKWRELPKRNNSWAVCCPDRQNITSLDPVPYLQASGTDEIISKIPLNLLITSESTSCDTTGDNTKGVSFRINTTKLLAVWSLESCLFFWTLVFFHWCNKKILIGLLWRLAIYAQCWARRRHSSNFCLSFPLAVCTILSHSVMSDSLQPHGL